MTLTKYPIKPYQIGDFYWSYADILRGIGVSTSMYDQRVLAFMALKLLVDNDKLKFNFDYKNQFGLSDELYAQYKGEDTKATFSNLMADIVNLGQHLKYFKQEAVFNPGEDENVLAYFNHQRTFPFDSYIYELKNHYLEMVLDIYIEKANFRDYPKEKYKDLYEVTVSRMKDMTGQLTGQHFTQKSIIHLMCEVAIPKIKKEDTIAIYDPACGTGSMIMEAAHYFKKAKKDVKIEVYGQEYHGQVWLLSKIFLEIATLEGETQGINNIIAYGNTLTNPAFTKGINGNDSFDFIIANPPFGVDWKHEKEAVMLNMTKGEDSNFFVIPDKKPGVFVKPRINDGQFLFMLHIIKMMLEEQKRGKRALAAVISSSTLISVGENKGAEAKIRRRIFEKQIVKAVIEQPHNMFTNTGINTHIWFLDTENIDTAYKKECGTIKVIKTENKEMSLFSKHPEAKDNMKFAYSDADIQQLLKLLNDTKETEYVTKNIPIDDLTYINIAQSVGEYKDTHIDDLLEIHRDIKAALLDLSASLQNDPFFKF